jgi:hypothetical protein
LYKRPKRRVRLEPGKTPAFGRCGALTNDEAVGLKKHSVEGLLRETATELVEGEALLAEKKKAKKKAKSKLERENAGRSAKTIKKAVDSIAAHRELLKTQIRRGVPKQARSD